MITRRSEFFNGIKAELPILMGVVPFGLIYGVAARSAGIPPLAGQSMSFIVFAGSAQFVTAQLIGAGVPAGIIILTAFIVNLRHALYSASLAPYLKRLNTRWRMLLAYLLTDEAYAVAITHYQKPGDISRKHWYFLGAGLALWSTWQASTAVGIVLGAQVPASWSLDFALPLTFIALVVPNLKDRAGTAAAATAGIIAILAASLPYKLGLIVASFVGISIGIFLESKYNKRTRIHKKEDDAGQIHSFVEPSGDTTIEHAEKEGG
ncbi:MAG: branched-chain amino acid ABC transporter permease [Ktedonobacter sp. 13_1_40CM_4_52_4]|nr:MAG: branched-chain amino acid ABC transporter permease [Ktedonobacter sp. 13_1_40CM_4_52_4]